jgi:hypothetical protein
LNEPLPPLRDDVRIVAWWLVVGFAIGGVVGGLAGGVGGRWTSLATPPSCSELVNEVLAR